MKPNLLRITVFSGLFLLLLLGGLLAAVFFAGKSGNVQDSGGGFYRLLHDYDSAALGVSGASFQDIEKLGRELDQLEKKAQTVESWLSVLKRRRYLSQLDNRFVPAWRQSARHAALAYPYSETVAAIAAAALVQDAAITREGAAELRSWLPLFADSRFAPLRLCIHVLLGDLGSPEKAAERLPVDLPAGLDSADLWRAMPYSSAELQAINADFAIVKTLRGDAASAALAIEGLLSAFAASSAEPSPDFTRFAAEHSYDFSALTRSAELFSRLPDDGALGRQADALYLAGFSGSARAIWAMLAASGDNVPGRAVAARSLYNLALTAESENEAAARLGQLLNLPGGGGQTQTDASSKNAAKARAALVGILSRKYGLIRYSRLLDAPRAIALLEAGKAANETGAPGINALPEFQLSDSALIDLEIAKRRTEINEAGRVVAETWLLLEDYPDAEALYCWAAWYFDLQRHYGETAVLLDKAARHGFHGQWVNLHQALGFVRAGDIDRAEEALAPILPDARLPMEAADWPVAANMGRILEARRAPAKAIEYYERAAAHLGGNKETASRIQVRIAQCLKTLGRPNESRRALEYALDLNPDNLNARLELHRLDM